MTEEKPEELPFHLVFPLTLEHDDGKDTKVCYFQCKEHLDKYVKRYKIKNPKVTKTVPRKKAKEEPTPEPVEQKKKKTNGRKKSNSTRTTASRKPNKTVRKKSL